MRLSPWERTKMWTHFILSAILIIAAIWVFKSCDNKKIKDITDEELKDNEKTAIIVDPSGKVTAITRRPRDRNGVRTPVLRGGKPESKDDDVEVIKGSDGARGSRLSIDKNGNITLTERTYGFLFEPGFGIYTTSVNTRVIIDSQILFYRRHGLNVSVGCSLNGRKEIRPGVAYSYLLPFKYLSNSSVFIGLDSDRNVFVGQRVRF